MRMRTNATHNYRRSTSREAHALETMGVYNEDWLKVMKKRGLILRVLTIIIGAITLVTWLFLDDFSLGMVWINGYTLTIGILFAVTLAFCVLTNVRDKKIYEEADREDDVAEGFA